MVTRPAIEPAFRSAIDRAGIGWTMGPADIARRRDRGQPNASSVVDHHDVRLSEHLVNGVPIALVEPRTPTGPPRPLVFYIHGGGMVTGNRYSGLDRLLSWLPLMDYVVASPEYRLAPEHPAPASADDCWNGLTGLLAEADDLNIDRERIVIIGSSAGGALAAGAAIRSRDAASPALRGLMLLSPMLDDRDDTASARQYEQDVPWTRGSNRTAWSALLGSPRREPVSEYVVPARARTLADLPTSFVDATTAEVFRDEDVTFASRLWADGVQAELHVWPGAVHGFDSLLPAHPISVAAHAARAAWLSRLMKEQG